jgi:hypothetical protein
MEFSSGSKANNMFSVPILSFSIIHAITLLLFIFSLLILLFFYLNKRRKALIQSLGAPDYSTAQLIIEGNFEDYETYEKAQKLGAKTIEDYKFLLEMQLLDAENE